MNANPVPPINAAVSALDAACITGVMDGIRENIVRALSVPESMLSGISKANMDLDAAFSALLTRSAGVRTPVSSWIPTDAEIVSDGSGHRHVSYMSSGRRRCRVWAKSGWWKGTCIMEFSYAPVAPVESFTIDFTEWR